MLIPFFNFYFLEKGLVSKANYIILVKMMRVIVEVLVTKLQARKGMKDVAFSLSRVRIQIIKEGYRISERVGEQFKLEQLCL